MSQKAIAGIVLIGTMAVCGIGWQVLPALQATQRTVDTQASVLLERARRLLHSYSPGLTHKSLLLDELSDAGADVEIDDPDALLDGAEDEYQQAHEKRWAAYQPYDYHLPAPPSAARARYGNLAQQVREGLRGRSDLLDRNARVLDEALAAVTQALDVKAGDASASAHAEANRLRGVILYHMALAERLGATLLRQQASHVRRELAAVGIHASMRGEDESGLEEQIGRLQAGVSEGEAELAQLRASFERIDRTIGDLEARLGAAEARVQEARHAMDELKRAGL
ncbi:MAG: hypothetical protein IID43_05655, partial [Planctomycetes bacterium]|nr:hypothetical protein [Planctomycetota bacterium]